MRASTAVILLVSLLPLPALAINKCKDASGKVVYQATPCDPSAKQEKVETDDLPRPRKGPVKAPPPAPPSKAPTTP